MTPFAYLQNALLLGGMFAIHWITGSWWGWLLLLFWLSPGGCDCKKNED